MAREIYPYDWAFHEQMAGALRLLTDAAQPESVIDTLEIVPFEEWDALVLYAVVHHPDEARRFLVTVAKYHNDDGWRFNAVRHLIESSLITEEERREFLQNEPIIITD